MIELLPFLGFFVAVVVPFVYYLIRKDGPAVEAVSLERSLFERGDLPPICCKTAARAEVGVTVLQRRWRRSVVEGIVPVTNDQRTLFGKWKRRNQRARIGLAVTFLAGFPLQTVDLSAAIDVAFTLLFFGLAATAAASNLIAQRCLCDPRLNRDGSVTLRGVHPAFVLAVQESRRATRPATTADKP